MRFLKHDIAPIVAGLLTLLAIVFAAKCAAHKHHHHAMHSMDGVEVSDAYMRVNGPNAKAAAAYMHIINHGDTDRLISAHSDVAARTELHTHIVDDDGVARMSEIEDGIELVEESMIMMERGGEHVMFMGLTQSLKQGDVIPLTLVFENSGEVVINVVVDNDRKPGAAKHNH